MPGGKYAFRFGDSANSMFDLLFDTVMPDARIFANVQMRPRGATGLDALALPQEVIGDFRFSIGRQRTKRLLEKGSDPFK